MFKRAAFALVFLFIFLGIRVQAQELYVKNKPFKGAVVKDGGKIWVGLEAFAQAIEWTLTGDGSNGYALSEGGRAEPGGSGQVAVAGNSVPYRSEGGEPLVSLLDIASLVGAKVIESKELGTIDVSFLKTKDEVAGGGVGAYRYTLVEYSDPTNQLCKDIQPAVAAARQQYHEGMGYVLCDVRKPGLLAQYKKYKAVKDGSFPEVVLIDSGGEVVFQLRGNHVIADKLMASLRKAIR